MVAIVFAPQASAQAQLTTNDKEVAANQKFLRRAIELSARASLEYSTGVFGAVRVKDSKMVSEVILRTLLS